MVDIQGEINLRTCLRAGMITILEKDTFALIVQKNLKTLKVSFLEKAKRS